ncbi:MULTISPECIES: hypothetical protein [Larkinella]|jgi:hypothetical protein|uniref:Uncharacterized protein n=1 Tax=Larkinella humicola TaxID=2607654 RepID=A0A5N1JSY9_9BACT|nr:MULTISPECIES: hypothetical protein [Larkinella]KAA9356893.1 hypothetical protein F0P93_03895 [Larkinella humicola]
MNALIDLKQIQYLEDETNNQARFLRESSFGWANVDIDNDAFRGMMTAHFQATNLNNQLRSLHQACKDYSVGNFEPYLDLFNRYRTELGGTWGYDPFAHLAHYFNAEYTTALPAVIEQYDCLVYMDCGYPKERNEQLEGIRKNNTGTNYSSNVVIDIEIGPSLKGYDEFYARCLSLINEYRKIGDVEECAKKILALFEPSVFKSRTS